MRTLVVLSATVLHLLSFTRSESTCTLIELIKMTYRSQTKQLTRPEGERNAVLWSMCVMFHYSYNMITIAVTHSRMGRSFIV